jgi:hypothetical protein
MGGRTFWICQFWALWQTAGKHLLPGIRAGNLVWNRRDAGRIDGLILTIAVGRREYSPSPIWSHTSLIIDRFFLLADKPRVDVPRSPAIRNVTGHVTEGARFLAGGTVVRRGLRLKGIIAFLTFPMGHRSHPLRVSLSIKEPMGI